MIRRMLLVQIKAITEVVNMSKKDVIETKKIGRAIMYRNPEGEVEELLAYIEHIEKQRDEAWEKVREWNKESEIQHAKENERAAYLQLSKGFSPDDDQWIKINEWERKHTEKYHKKPKVEYLTKKMLNGPHYSYRFEYSPIGTLGDVVCTVCEHKALKRCLGNEMIYGKLLDKYDARFMFGEV